MANYFGIDFGTTNSAVHAIAAIGDTIDDEFDIGENDRRPLPSFVAIHKVTGEVVTGLDAKGRIADENEYQVFSSIKTIIGEEKEWQIAGNIWTPVDIAAELFKELKNPQTDWRMVLNDFVQQEIVDYSFTPPDRRFDESPFFLPDFNDKDDLVEDILFMIDTSASMSDDMITAAYSEVKGAIDQFDGKLKGWLGFFDTAIVEPKLFINEEEFRIIKPAGGGGTDFQIIFEYVQKHMQEKLPACIIILTDGFAPFPKEKLAGGVPVLWLLNNDEADPPWGKIARITV